MMLVNGVGVVDYEKPGNSALVLVLLHGFTGSADGWSNLLEELPGKRVIALDMLGHGASDAPEDPRRYALEYCEQDIIAVLRELGVGEGEAVLLGYSMGGRIALYCAFSGFFRALILESASPGVADSEERAARRASDERLAERIEREGVPAFVAYWENIPLFASQRALPLAEREQLRAARLRNRARGLAHSLRGAGTGAQPALHERLAQLDLPALLIVGEQDTKFCALAQQMAQRLPRADLRIVPAAGHTVHLERPAYFCALVREFCASLVK